MDIDECEPVEKACSGAFDTCSNEIGSFQCPCDGFQRKPSNGVCKDIDECTMECSDELEDCQNQIGSYTCNCLPGYERSNDDGSCSDINECYLETGKCSGLNESCLNEIGVSLASVMMDSNDCQTIQDVRISTNVCCPILATNRSLLARMWLVVSLALVNRLDLNG